MSGFTRGLDRFLSSLGEDALSTGCDRLDLLLGGLRPGRLYLVYGDPDPVEELLIHILVESLRAGGRAAYMLCGNYRVEKTLLNVEGLVRLLEESGLAAEDALKRVYVLCAFSADQQAGLIDEISDLLARDPEVRLVLVRDIAKLVTDDARSRSRAARSQELQGAALRLKQACAERNVPLVVSCRSRRGRGLLPMPEGGEFLRHLANVILYLHRSGRGAAYVRAHLLKHPAQVPRTVEYSLRRDVEVGRSTPPFRVSFEETVARLRKEFQKALVDRDRREAFEALVEAWSSELGAMSYAESLTLFDLMLLAAVVDNRSLIARLMKGFDDLRAEMGRLRERDAEG
ncbi:hypothetical protein DRO42_02680 [Candidatus Bathyarchaeota archaeon]|nr:MAG: hypothetical protein DRO42_02680 [Candidatus Bathyarchaeota archaeon]